MRKRNFITLLILFAIVLWTAFAFRNSMQSANVSDSWSKSVLSWIHLHIPSLGFLTDHALRKFAHFFEYSILGFLSAWFWHRLFNSHYIRTALFLIIAVPIPFIDEFIQGLTDGRNKQFSDVLLDCSGLLFGAVTAVFAITLFKSVYRHISEGRSNGR